MLNSFRDYISQQNLISPGSTTLLAVSGGRDSMVMAELFVQCKLSIKIAHINHHLRGAESDEDARLVADYCKNKGIHFFKLDIDPVVFENGNLQQKARIIRYEWLMNLAEEQHCAQIATAHHRDDVIETFIMNIMRGSGLSGLSGMEAKVDKIIRPLLWASRMEITDFASKQKIPYRDDASNDSDKYLRNRIRHQILPQIYTADYRSDKGMLTTIQNVHSADQVLSFLVEDFFKQSTIPGSDLMRISIGKIRNLPLGAALLFQKLKIYGFSSTQCDDMLTAGTSAFFTSSSHEGVIHGNNLIIRPKKDIVNYDPVVIQRIPCAVSFSNFRIELTTIDELPNSLKDSDFLYLDADQLHFPLVLRKQLPGDIISPLGMKGQKQKVKDYLTNKKLSVFEKEDIQILADTQGIVALLMTGISERVKITKQTKHILKVIRT